MTIPGLSPRAAVTLAVLAAALLALPLVANTYLVSVMVLVLFTGCRSSMVCSMQLR